MSVKLIKKLKNIKAENGGINPDRVWVAQNRVKMLEEIKCSARVQESQEEARANIFDTISEGLHIFVSGRVLSMARSSLTVLLIGAVAVSGWIASVSASVDSLPGDVLYGVKMAAEKTELIVASVVGSEENTVTTILKHASSRVDEYQRSESTEQASVAIKSLVKKIESTQESMDKVNEKSPELAVAVAKVVEKKTEEILDTLSGDKSVEKSSDMASKSEVDNVQLSKEVVEAEVLIQKTGINAVEVLIENVENKQVGSDVITKEEVKDTINRKLDKVVAGVSKLDVAVGQTSEIASSTIAIIKTASTTKFLVDQGTEQTNMDGGVAKIIDITANTSASSTSLISTQIGATAQKVVEAEQRVVEATKKVEETKVEVKNLIDQNNLTGALDKIKELDGVKVQTSVVVVEVNKVVAEVQKVLINEVKPVMVVSTTLSIVLPDAITSTTVQQAPSAESTASSTTKTNY